MTSARESFAFFLQPRPQDAGLEGAEKYAKIGAC